VTRQEMVVVLALAGWLAGSASARGQAPTVTPASQPAPAQTAAPAVEVREHIVVTGVAESAPVTVTSDPRLPRQPMPAHDGADYLDTVPGFATIRKGGSGGDPVFRGMAGSRVSILVDDAALLGGCSSRMDAPTAYIFPETFDRITIVKGPQTVKHGAPASAATVLFERTRTRLDAPSWQGNASVLGGSWGRNDQVADVRAGTPAFYVRAAGSRSAMDDYAGGDGTTVHSQYLRWNADAALGWTPDAQTLLEVGVTGSDGHAAYADRGVDGSKFLRLGTSARFERTRPGSRLHRVDVTGAYNYVDHIMDNHSLRQFVQTAMSPTPSSMNPDRTTYGGRLATRWLGQRTTWDIGTDVQVNAHANRMSMNQAAMPVEQLARVADARFVTTGVFVETNYQVRAKTLVVGGLRVDRASGTDLRNDVALTMMQRVINPTARMRRTDVLTSAFGRVEQQVRDLPVTAYLGVGRVQRFPDYWELIAREALDSVSAFGTRPETTTQVDAGLQWRRRATSVYLAVFGNRIDDFVLIQSAVAKPAMMGTRTTIVTRNIDARSHGAEGGVSQRVGRVSTDVSLAWTRGTNRTDALPLAQTPPLDARLSTTYDGGRWSVGGLVRAVAAQRRVALNQGNIVGQDVTATPGFAVMSVNAGWKLAAATSLAVGIDNLLDRDYAEHISRQGAAIPGFAVQTGQLREPGRTWWVRLNVRR
jgi:iron complex outermembrane receptor protein